MATLVSQVIIRGTPITPTFSAVAGGGDACDCGDNIFVEVKNTSGSSCTVTFQIPAARQNLPGVAYTSPTMVVPITTGDKMFGPISALVFQDPTTGLCTINYSVSASITIAVFNLQEP